MSYLTTIPLPFDLELPIIQAPMAGVQGSVLALAVSNAGGLGSLPCAMLSPDGLRAELQALKQGTTRPYNVNFFCHTSPVADPAHQAQWLTLLEPYHRAWGVDPLAIPTGPGRVPFDAATAELLEAFQPPVVSFHFGLPSAELVARVKAWSACVMSSATTLEEAVWLHDHGADVIIAQGLEAGGHRGMFLTQALNTQRDVRSLVRQIVGAVQCPVVAAGGIATAQDVQDLLALGAAAVQVGSAYLLSPQATTPPLHRLALQSADAKKTALTNLFTGRPARGIVNRFMREQGPLQPAAPAFPLAAAAVAPLRARAETAGCADFSPLWAGENAWRAEPIDAAELTRALANG